MHSLPLERTGGIARSLILATFTLVSCASASALKYRGGNPPDPATASGQKPERLVFIGIYTAAAQQSAARREEIRATYWQHPLLQPGGSAYAKFVVGHFDESRTDSAALALRQDLESNSEDFLQLDVEDAYGKLTSKTFALLRWFVKKGNAKYLLKIDDDTYPHLDRIVKRLGEVHDQYLHMGFLFPCAPVLKKTKWAENPKVWNHSFFPKYMQGSGYLLSAPLVHEMAVNMYEKNVHTFLNNEDAAVGVWIEHSRTKDPTMQIAQRNVASTLSGCKPGDLFSMNNKLNYMKCYWDRYQRKERDVCCYGPLNNMDTHAPKSLLQLSSSSSVAAASALKTQCYRP